MGDGLTTTPIYHAGQQDGQSFSEFLDELVAYYMALGMTREAVLYGERSAFDDYEKAHEFRHVQENQRLHLQGYYDYIAVSCALSAAFADKGKKGTPYPQHPIPITETERNAEKRRNIEKTLAFVRGRKRNV